jgi:zinc transport system substrate-binding protein
VEETLFYNASWRYSSPYRCYFVSRLLLGLLFSCFVVNASAEVRVLTSIKPLQLIAAAVQEGVGSPAVLLPSSASAHNYALRPSDVRQVQDVQLLYWIGPDMESFLPRVLAARQRPTVAVQDLPGLHLRHFGQTQPAAEHDDEHESSAADGEHDHAHRPGTLDAHLWLLPANAQVIATRMAADLSAADPLNAPRYQANLQAFRARLKQLDMDIKARLLGVADKPYFVFHEAFDYFEEAYGLKHAGVFSVASEVQPGAQHVAQMRERLQAAGPTCVFSEPSLRPRLAQTLSAGLPVTLAELDAMGGKLAVNATGYEQLLSILADDLSGCLRRL